MLNKIGLSNYILITYFLKCDQGDEKNEPCPASGKFSEGLNAGNSGEESTNDAPSKQWEALDQFNID